MMSQAMLLAAGHGTRMRPLTDNLPKPLLEAGGKPLIVHQIERLRSAGYTDLVINHARLGEMLEQALGDGSRWDMDLRYSAEGELPLETAGGIVNALPLLDSDPFVVVNADVYTDFPYGDLPVRIDTHAHIVLVRNPDHHPAGDFAIQDGLAHLDGEPRYTFGGIGVYKHALFSDLVPGEFAPLGPLLAAACKRRRVSAQLYDGLWEDVGTPDRLKALNSRLKGGA